MSKSEQRFDQDKCAEVASKVTLTLLTHWRVGKDSPFYDALKQGLIIKVSRFLTKMSTYTRTQEMKNSKLKGCSTAEHKAYIRAAEEAHEASQLTLGMIIADELCEFHKMSLKSSEGLLCEYFALAANFDAELAPSKLLEKLKKTTSGSKAKSRSMNKHKTTHAEGSKSVDKTTT